MTIAEIAELIAAIALIGSNVLLWRTCFALTEVTLDDVAEIRKLKSEFTALYTRMKGLEDFATENGGYFAWLEKRIKP